jgi:serine/threonine-protein kinase HipA
MDDNALNFDLAKSVGEYFRLNDAEMKAILHEVLTAVKEWKTVAKRIGIKKSEMKLMASAFRR